MIFVMIDLFDVQGSVVCGYFHKFPVDISPEFCGNDRVTVFGWKDDVVITEVDGVTCSSVVLWLGHTVHGTIVRRS